MSEMGELKEAGCVAVSDDGKPVKNAELMRRALQYAQGMGILVISHAEELDLVGEGTMNEGFTSTELGRITSYNVCYTKLLRGVDDVRAPFLDLVDRRGGYVMLSEKGGSAAGGDDLETGANQFAGRLDECLFVGILDADEDLAGARQPSYNFV